MYKISKIQTGTEFQNAAGVGIGEIDGNSYQATRSGKNLLKDAISDSGDGNYWSSYSTFDKATRTLTRTLSTTTEGFIQHKIDGIKSNTTYTLSFEAKSNGYVSSMDMFCFNADTQGIKSSGGHTLTTSFQKFVWAFTTDSSVDYSTGSSIRIDNNGSTTSGTDATLTIKDAMLVEGTDSEYEEYGVSPTPNYPSEIEEIEGENYLDMTNILKNVYINSNSKNIMSIDGGAIYYFKCKKNTTYKMKRIGGDRLTIASNTGGLTEGSSVNILHVGSDEELTTSTYTFTTNSTDTYVLLFLARYEYTRPTKVVITDGHIRLRQTGKNLLDMSSMNAYQKTGIEVSYKDGYLILNGTASATTDLYIYTNNSSWFTFKEFLNSHYGTYYFYTTKNYDCYAYLSTSGYLLNKFTTSKNDKIANMFIRIPSGTVCKNEKVGVMIVKGSTKLNFEIGKETLYDIDLDGNALCKVGDIQDVLNIDKQGNVSITKNIASYTFTGNEAFAKVTEGYYMAFTCGKERRVLCNKYPNKTVYSEFISADYAISFIYNSTQLYIRNKDASTAQELVNILKDNTYFYFQITSPKEIQLPYTTPIKLYEGYNNFELLTNLDTDYSITTYYKPMTDEVKTRVKNGKIVRAYMKFPATDTEEELIVDEKNYLKELTFSDERYVPDEGFIGQAVAKEVTGEFYNVSTDFNIQDREFELYVGVELEDETTEYIKYGTFIVQKPENDTVEDNTSFTALDYMVKFNQEYTDRVTYPCTLRTLFEDICDQAGVNYNVPSFLNENFVLEDNQLETGTTLREALKGIAQIAFNWARIDEEDMLVMDFDKDTESIETLDPSQFFSLTTQNQYGELNTIVLRNSQVEGENYTIVDKDRVAKDGTIELTISDNPFAYTQEKRQELIQVGEELFGLKYIPLTISGIGLFYLNCNDKIKPTDTADKEYESYIFNHSFTYNGVISEENIESKAQTLTETKYQYTAPLEKIYQHTELVVDKAKQEITATIENDTVSKSEYSEFKQDLQGWQATVSLKEEVTEQIEKLTADINGLTNQMETKGGNNIFYYSTDFWSIATGATTECLEEVTNTDIQQNGVSGMGYILNKGTSEQKQNVKNDNYTVSFSFKKTVSLSNQYIYINNTKYTITPNSLNTWQEFVYNVNITTTSIDIKIESDTNSSAYITDFMVGIGTEKQVWTQNPNETFTDTVTIGKGITVRSSVSNTYTTINNDGNRTFNSDTGERVAEMTDKGVYAKELDVEGKTEIGDLLIQTIDSQVWLTGIGG